MERYSVSFFVRERATSAEIKTSKDLYEAVKDLADADREMFVVILLNARQAIIGREVVSIGTLNQSLVHPREVFKSAIVKSAGSIVIVHNHPGGTTTPSCEDDAVTRRLVSAGKIIGIPILDHIIVGDNGYYSYRDHGVLS